MNLTVLLSALAFVTIFIMQKVRFYEILKLHSFGIYKNDYLIFVSVSLIILFAFLSYYFANAIKNAKNANKTLLDKKICLLFLFLSVYPTLNIFASNFSETNYKIGFWFVLFFFFVSFLLFFIFKILLKNEEKAIFCTLAFSVFINFSQMYRGLALSFFAFSMFLSVLFLELNIEKLKKPLIIFSLVLMFFVSFDFLKNAFLYIKLPHKQEILSVSHNKPEEDVYIIVSDMYAGSDTLVDDYDFDNSYFYNALRSLGFEVFDSIYSNYNKTQLTMGSVLNGKYISDMKFKTFGDAFSNAEMFKKAKEKGYQTNVVINISAPEKSPYIDKITIHNKLDIGCQVITFLNNTAFKFILKKCETIDNSGIVSLILNGLIPEYKKSGGNFYFVHILAPHYPYAIPERAIAVYDIGGAIKGEHFANKQRYLEYLNYVNYEILNTVKNIIKNSDKKPIIVITGDHGTRLHLYSSNEEKYFSDLINENHFLRAHFNTFFAIYCPKEEKARYKGINSLINFFIEFQNARFSENNERKEDKFYFLFTNESNTDFKDAQKKYIELKKCASGFIPYYLLKED